MGQYFTNIRLAASSIFEGMAVTMSWLVRKPVTIQYPDRTAKPVVEMLPERSRGILEVDPCACIADSQCMRACPIGVILIEYGKTADGKGRTITRFDIDASKCMHCGLCTEVCPTSAIRHSHEFEGCTRDVRNLVLHYVDEPVAPWKLQKDVKAPITPLGRAARKALKKWDAAYASWSPKAPPPLAPPADDAPKSPVPGEEPASTPVVETKPEPEPRSEPTVVARPLPDGMDARDLLAAVNVVVEKARTQPPAPAAPTTTTLVVPSLERDNKAIAESTLPPPKIKEVPEAGHAVEPVEGGGLWTEHLQRTPEPVVVQGNVDSSIRPASRPQQEARVEEQAAVVVPKVEEEKGFSPPPDDPALPMEQRFMKALPQIDGCGLCGYPNCREYARALATRREHESDLCEPGGKGTAGRVALLLRKMKKKETVKTE